MDGRKEPDRGDNRRLPPFLDPADPRGNVALGITVTLVSAGLIAVIALALANLTGAGGGTAVASAGASPTALGMIDPITGPSLAVNASPESTPQASPPQESQSQSPASGPTPVGPGTVDLAGTAPVSMPGLQLAPDTLVLSILDIERHPCEYFSVFAEGGESIVATAEDDGNDKGEYVQIAPPNDGYAQVEWVQTQGPYLVITEGTYEIRVCTDYSQGVPFRYQLTVKVIPRTAT